MDSIIPLGQKNTLAEYMILSGADNHPPMLDKDLYDSWKSRMELYMKNREHRIMILELVEHGPLIWPTIEENGVTRIKKYVELSAAEKIQADCDLKATNIILQGLPADIYLLVNQHRVAKDLWERVQLQMQGLVIMFISTNNQLRTSSNLRNQATIQDGGVIVQQVQGIQGQSYSSTSYKSNATSSEGNNASGQARVVKCYNRQGKGHMARQCTQPKRPKNTAWYKDIAMSTKAQEAGHILDEEQLAFLADLGILDGQAVQTIIPNNVAFQTEDLDTYDSDCDDASNAKSVLMANIFNYGSDVISEDFKQTPVIDVTDNEITSDSNIILYSQYLQETQQANDTNLQAQQDSMILSVIEQMSEQMINHVNNWEKANKEHNNESVTAELERYKERVKIFEQCLNINLSSREKND
ncbi:hypothetical protein Tco_1163932 [Tanacetum coccineum]